MVDYYVAWSTIGGGCETIYAPFAETIVPAKPAFANHRMARHADARYSHMLFVDLETSGLITHAVLRNAPYDCVPSITQLALIAYRADEFLAPGGRLPEACEERDVASAADPRTYVDTFLAYVEKYNSPLVVAHNGLAFDFKLLIANTVLYRGAPPPADIKLFDSYVAVKSRVAGLPSYKNCNLFSAFVDHYAGCSHYAARAHDAFFDCRMTALWLHHLRDRIAFDHFCYTPEAIAQWSDQQQRLAPAAKSYKIKCGDDDSFQKFLHTLAS